jgi:glucose/arabinose dehydrogenase
MAFTDRGKAQTEEHLLRGLNERVRDVRQEPDGGLWLLTGNPAGRILRVSPVLVPGKGLSS